MGVSEYFQTFVQIRRVIGQLFLSFLDQMSGHYVIFVLQTTVYTLYNAILRIARIFMETRENITIWTNPFYHINLGWFSWEWSQSFFFSKKKFKMADSKKAHFSKSPILKNFSRKFLRFVRLSDKSSKTAKKYRKCIFWLFLSFCRTASRPYTLSYIDALRIIQSY